jgi:hypothetical protein
MYHRLLACSLLGLSLACASVADREAVLKVARPLIGTTEATGNNDGPIIDAILGSVGLAGTRNPYCAAFNYYCYETAGQGAVAPRSAWSPDWLAKPTWLKGQGREPQPADAFGIYFASKKRVAHTGLVEKWGQTVLTIEGNTSPQAGFGSEADRNGDGIWRKRRLAKQIHSVKNWLD